MSKTVCEPFEYTQLCNRSLPDFINVDGEYAFGTKLLKYVRPFLQVVHNKELSSNPNIQPQLYALLQKHLGQKKALSDKKWITLGYEIELANNLPLLEMWLDARPNSVNILASTPSTCSRELEILTAKILPHFLRTNQPQKLHDIIQTWSAQDKERIALNCEDLHPSAHAGLNVFAVFGGHTPNEHVIENLCVAQELVEIYPEYFKAHFNNNLNKFIDEEGVLKKMKGFLPPQVLAVLGAQDGNNLTVQIALQYLTVLPPDWQERCIEDLKKSPHTQQILDACPQLKAFVEKKSLNEAVGELQPVVNRRSKL